MNAQPLLLRALQTRDLEQMVTLEQRCYDAPWSRAMLRSELSRELGVRIGAFDDERLIGQMIVSRLGQTWHVMNVAVDPDLRRHGIASRLLVELLARIGNDDLGGYTLEVRVSNLPAVELYRRFGFSGRGIRPGYYVDNREDALVMWRPPQSVLDAGGIEALEWEPPT